MTLSDLIRELSWFEAMRQDDREVQAVTPHGSYVFEIEDVTGQKEEVIMLHLVEASA